MARSAWLRHVMAVRGQNKGMAFKDVLKLAKRSYKKGGGMQGGNKFQSQPASVGGDALEDPPQDNGTASKGMEGGEPTEAPQEGGRRRRRRGSRKSKRKSRKGKSRRKSRKGKSRKSRKTKRRRRRRR